MKINGNRSFDSSGPQSGQEIPKAPHNLQEIHEAATDPDFKVTRLNAKRFQEHSIARAESLMASLPLDPQSLIALFAIARVKVLWILGEHNASLRGRLATQISDERLSLLERSDGSIAPDLFNKQMSLLIEAVASLLEEHEKAAFRREIADIVVSQKTDLNSAALLFPLLFSFITPKWEEAATRNVHAQRDVFVDSATQRETEYFSKFAPSHFKQGQTARWIEQAVEVPKKHGLKQSSLTGTFAVYRLQSALVCDVICYDKEIAIEMLPETLQLDVGHLKRLQKRFGELVDARCLRDFRAATIGKGMTSQSIENFNKLLEAKSSPVATLHRERLRGLLVESVYNEDLNQSLIDKWHYSEMRAELKELSQHVVRIMEVHFPVFHSLYSELLEAQIERTIFSSILSLNGNSEFRDWLNVDDNDEAFRIRSEFKRLLEQLVPCVRMDQRPFLERRLHAWLLGNSDWEGIRQTQIAALSEEHIRDCEMLYKSIVEFSASLKHKRYNLSVDEKNRRLPRNLKTGY